MAILLLLFLRSFVYSSVAEFRERADCFMAHTKNKRAIPTVNYTYLTAGGTKVAKIQKTTNFKNA